MLLQSCIFRLGISRKKESLELYIWIRYFKKQRVLVSGCFKKHLDNPKMTNENKLEIFLLLAEQTIGR